jgi:hypothetical protein
MAARRGAWATLGGTLLGGGLLLMVTATERDTFLWIDPVFWLGIAALIAGAVTFLWLLLPPWLTDRRARQGRANQRQGLDEILRELGGISKQLKAELRWGQRGTLFPNSAWTKNQHLVTGDVHTLVASAYAQAYWLDLETVSAKQEDLDNAETEERTKAKHAVDAAAEAVRGLLDEVEP